MIWEKEKLDEQEDPRKSQSPDEDGFESDLQVVHGRP
jgi:hypothetical protein